MNHASLFFDPKNGSLAVISRMLTTYNYSMLENIGEKRYKANSGDNNVAYLDLGEGKLIFRYISPEIKEKNKNFLKELEKSLK
ncbi:hypothetical protein HYS72_03030 [Candidatus Pacearchaeota archaeon]|nr:hypothetical protein [Candidatus Pacearchaeota archaeon]MBI2057224.1 hypothetical protein [Candidatus Pacearchaeota archaeon]